MKDKKQRLSGMIEVTNIDLGKPTKCLISIGAIMLVIPCNKGTKLMVPGGFVMISESYEEIKKAMGAVPC